MPPYDLTEAINEAIRQNPGSDSYAIADILAASIPSSSLRKVLQAVLPSYIAPRLRLPVAVTHLGTDARSGKLTARRNLMEKGTWAVTLPGIMGGGQVQLKDLTANQCDQLASFYEAKSEEAVKNAQGLRALAKAMRKAGVVTVEDLGKKKILQLLGVDDEAKITMLPVGAV